MRKIEAYFSANTTVSRNQKHSIMTRHLKFIILLIIISSKSFSQDSTKNQNASTQLDTSIYEKVEVEAMFPGGVEAWKKYLIKNLKVTIPVKNSAPAGTYKVVVKFIVAKDGGISNIVAETNHGFGMEEEVIRIIKKSPNWTPATQNGNIVKAYRRQPITFLVSEN